MTANASMDVDRSRHIIGTTLVKSGTDSVNTMEVLKGAQRRRINPLILWGC